MTVEDIARICHEVNRAYCKALGDYSQVPWEVAPEWAIQSAIDGVAFHLSGERKPSDSHDNWLAHKAAQGWKYGPVKDPDKKEHPCMVAFHDLPIEQKAKDYIFKAVVDALRKEVSC